MRLRRHLSSALLRRAAAGAALLGAAFTAALAASLLGSGDAVPPAALAAPEPAPKGAPTAPAPGPVALLATRPGATVSTLHLAALGAADPGPSVATLTHLPDAAVRASVVPGTSLVMATADAMPGRDLSFNAGLFRLEPHKPPAELCDRVVYASRPLVTDSGRVFVSRGVAGPEPTVGAGGKIGALRVDALSVDEVDPATGATRTVHTLSGQLAFLAGAWKGEVIVYRVWPAGADLVAIDPDSGAERVLLPSIPPFARDFSVDAAGGLVFEERDATDPSAWTIERLDLATGQRARLVRSATFALAPHAWPGGGVAYTPDPRAGLALLGAGAPVRGPLGPGVDAIQAVSPGGAWVAALHTRPGTFDVPFAVRADTGEVKAIPRPPGARIAVAGFIAGGGP